MAPAAPPSGRDAEADAPAGLSPEQLKSLHDDGFLVLPHFASAEQCQGLMRRMEELVTSFQPQTFSVFSTKNQKKKTDEYFLNSGGTISFFFEEKAFDENDNLQQDKALSINKVGHALHDLDPTFRAFSRSQSLKALVRSLGFSRPIPVQSMYIFKQPGIGGEVVPHQDSTFLFTQPLSCFGLWVALQKATEENGCLFVLPGSHKNGLKKKFVREDGTVRLEDLPSSQPADFDLSRFVAVPVEAGSLVILHGAVVHFSYENRSPKSRHAYSLHVIESRGCTYPSWNWLQRRPGVDLEFEPLYGN